MSLRQQEKGLPGRVPTGCSQGLLSGRLPESSLAKFQSEGNPAGKGRKDARCVNLVLSLGAGPSRLGSGSRPHVGDASSLQGPRSGGLVNDRTDGEQVALRVWYPACISSQQTPPGTPGTCPGQNCSLRRLGRVATYRLGPSANLQCYISLPHGVKRDERVQNLNSALCPRCPWGSCQVPGL